MAPMVRREADPVKSSRPESVRCTTPAGESPVPVSAGAPGSRPQVSVGDPGARAGRQEPLRREQPRGPQHKVKPAASTHSQPGSRADHVAAKATCVAPVPERAADAGGVWGVARVEGGVRNTGDPSVRSLSRPARPYKPSVKSVGVQRESEGVEVPMRAVQQNAALGKDPCGSRVGGGGKREGMSGHRSRINHPPRA